MSTNIRMGTIYKVADLVYPELSHRIIGVLFDVFNELGPGLSEKTYQRATAVGLKYAGLKFEEQVYSPLMFRGEKVRNNYFDFFIEGKIVLELKKGQHSSLSHIEQLKQYLVSKKLKLGILAYFAFTNLHFKRVLNLN